MNHISHVGDIHPDVCDIFLHHVLDVAIEDIDKSAVAEQRLFEGILPIELDPMYAEILQGELTKLGFGLDKSGNMAPILCQNVRCHVDQISGSNQSVIVNISHQSGELLLHKDKNGDTIDRMLLERGKVLSFDHHNDYHSVEYTGDPEHFLVIVRASVVDVLKKRR